MAEHLTIRVTQKPEAAERAWAYKRRTLERLLRRVPEDQRHLRLLVREEGGHVKASAVLSLPTGVLSALAEGEAVDAVVREVGDTLVKEVRRHLGRLRDLRRGQTAAQRESMRRAAEPLETLREGARREEFWTLVRPVLGSLARYAGRELRLAEREGAIPRGAVAVQDLLDDVTVQAWERYGERAPDEPVDHWLLKLLHRRIEELREQEGPVALSQVVEVAREEDDWIHDNDPYWPEEDEDEEEALLLEDLFPDPEAPLPEEELAAEEETERILACLAAVPAPQRQAFQLHVIEGFDVDDVAMVQGRSAAEVRRDVEAVRAALAKAFG